MRALLLVLLLLPSLACAQAGRVLLAVGEVEVLRGGGRFPATAGVPVQPGDVIRLGARSNAQIRLSDESIIALRPGTELRIDAYSYSGQADDTARSFFSLVRGGLRTVTGAIGQLHDKERYRVRTHTATIGIRGTHYVLVHCDNDCGAGTQNGTYGGVSDGRIGVENQSGEQQFGPQQFFHVASADAAPQGLIGPPAFLYDRLEGQERSRGRQGAETSENMARSGLDAESRPSTVPAAPMPPTFIVTEQRDATGNLVVLDTLAVQGGVAFATPDLADLQEGTSALTLDETGTRLEAFSATNDFGDAVTASRGSASFADTGGTAAGDVFWGRWTPGAVANVTLGDSGPLGDIAPGTGIHWIFGDATPPATVAARTGSVSYVYAGGTNPTDGSGAAGTMDSANSAFTVDFTSRSVSGDLVYTVAGVTYAIQVSSTIRLLANKAIFTDVRDGPDVLPGSTCSTCSGLIDATSVGGMFHGPTGNGLGVTFATADATAGESAGAAYFGAEPPAAPLALGFGFSEPAHDIGGEHGTQVVLTLDGTGTVLEFVSGTECFSVPCQPYSLNRNGAAVADVGGDTSVATVRWGRWGAGSQWTHPNDGTTTPPTGIHWIFGDSSPFATVGSRTGSVIYQHAGGTNPTDHAGNVGTMLDSSFFVEFTTQRVTGSINYTVGGVGYNLAVPDVPIVQSNGVAVFSHNPLNVGGFCSTCSGNGGSYNLGGTFMGAQGGGIAATWGTHHVVAGQTAGAGYFTASNPPPPDTALVLALLNTANAEGDDPAAFAVQSHLSTAGTTLNAFNTPSYANIDPTAGARSGSGGTITNETTTNAIGAYWGRWAGGSMTEILGTTTFSSTNQLHYVVGPLTPDSVIAGKTGTFAFNLVGGTTPTNNLGDPGTMSGTTLSVDFTNRNVSWPVTGFAFPSQTWSFPTTTSNINVDATRGAAYTDNNITGSCAGLGCAGGPSARLVRTGVFMGPAGDHLGVSFAAKTATSGASMQASGLFACTPTC